MRTELLHPGGEEVHMVDREARASRLADFFDVQLRLAEHLAARTARPLGETVVQFTTFHRRFGFGDPDKGRAPAWAGYADRLERLPTAQERLAWTVAFFRQAPEEPPPPGQHAFGCFSCDAPDARGVVRIHFLNKDADGTGPLARAKISRRQRELADVFGFVRERYPAAARVVGISWLYHLDAYRRLFPPDYGASAVPAARVRLCGMSSWGQLIAHDGTIKPALRDAFVRSFSTMDIEAPWRSFPLPALIASAPIASFFAFYPRA